MRLITTLSAFLLTAASGPASDSPGRAPVFGSGVEVVNLNVSVASKAGRCVSDLRETDFEVFEDGVRQSLSMFTQQSLPLSVAVLVDSSDSMTPKMSAAQGAAAKLVASLRPDDQIEVIQFSGQVRVLQPFTRDRALVDTAIRSIEVRGGTSLYDSLYVVLKDLQKTARSDPMRRFAMVLLSDGRDTSSLSTEEQIVELARRSEIAVHTVGLPDPINRAMDPLDSSRVDHFLISLARETGGRAYFPVDLRDLDGLYTRIGEELRAQYSIAYVPAQTRSDGRWRRIAVLVHGRGDVAIRHKPGYYGGARRTAR
jgi:Ca-activated chloride channel family protein